MTTQTPIILFRGDNTAAFNLRTLKIKLSGDLDVSSATAKFTLLTYTKTFTAAEVATKELTFSFTSDDTNSFPVGSYYGTFTLYDSDGRQLTIVNTIPFEVTNKVCGVETATYSIDVSLSVNTDINITFNIEGGGGSGGESLWKQTGTVLEPKTTAITGVTVPSITINSLSTTDSIGDSYTLADVKNKLNAILAKLKGN